MKPPVGQTKTALLKQNISLLGKQVLKPEDLSCVEIKSLLWTAFDLKKVYGANYCYSSNLKGKNVTLLMNKPSVVTQVVAAKACSLLQVKLNIIIEEENRSLVKDLGKLYLLHSDLLLCKIKSQFNLEKMITNTKVPLMVLGSCKFNMFQTISHLMTIQEYYGYLNHLNLAFVGGACPTINTYLCFAPRLGMNIRYYCACEASGCRMSPAQLPIAKKACAETETELKECSSVTEAVNKAHVITVTSAEETEHLKVKVEHLKKADERWSLFHGIPRRHDKMTEVYDDTRNLVWESSKNSVYVLAALILRLLQKHDNVTEKPDFERLKSRIK